jgi:hypothetical protein
MQTLASLTLLTLILLSAQALPNSNHTEYIITLNLDRSATWRIIQVTDSNYGTEDLEQFQQKIITTITLAEERAKRDMALDLTSLEIKLDMHWETSSQTIEYLFRWENFSTVKDDKLIFGDAFSTDFFSTLYGDGELYVNYPNDYSMMQTSPLPNEQDRQSQTLHWYRTQDLTSIQSQITFTKNEATTNPPFVLPLVASGGFVVAATVSFLLLNRRRHHKTQQIVPTLPMQETKNSEEKVLELLKASRQGKKQSDICEELKFSRAKTSLLLAEMEKTNKIVRNKIGKNKIVYYNKKAEGDKIK